MAGGSTDAVLAKHLHALYHAGAIGGLSDGQLLDRFVAGGDPAAEAAFTALAERHGPMVLRVCRQMLGDPHAAQDAFQATFLVLVRKAASVRNRDSVASWLHGVARRVAMRARVDAARRQRHERRGAAAAAATQPPGDGERPESWTELHEEVSRLPEKYRGAVVLCYLEGLTTEAAAQRLGCPQGTVLSRLSRARDRLRARLTRRGLVLPAAGLSPEAATSAVPAALLDATVRASLGFLPRQASGAALASTSAVILARGVLFTMTLSKLKVLAAAALACVLTLGGVRTLARPFGGDKSAKAQPVADDRPAALTRSVEKLQAELDESTRRNAELRKELQDIRAQLKALREGPRAAEKKAIGARDGERKMSIRPGAGAAIATAPGSKGPDAPPGGPEQPSVTEHGKFLLVVSPRGDKIMIYNTETKQTQSVRLSASKEPPLVVTPIIGPGVVALLVSGPKITRIAAARNIEGPWHTQDLREPVEGKASPMVFPNMAAYFLGRYVYAFSPEKERWDVLKLPEGVSGSPNMGIGSVVVRGGGHIYTFTASTGKWDDLDINAILNADDEDGGKGNAVPKK